MDAVPPSPLLPDNRLLKVVLLRLPHAADRAPRQFLEGTSVALHLSGFSWTGLKCSGSFESALHFKE